MLTNFTKIVLFIFALLKCFYTQLKMGASNFLTNISGNVFRLTWFFTAIYILNFSVAKAQDPIFSQFFHAPQVINPALSGITNGPLVHLNYRNQWPSIQQAYSTFALSYSQKFNKQRSGIGALIISDQSGNGILNTTKGTLAYSYNLKIKGDTYIKGGLDISAGTISLDWNKFIFGDAIDAFGGTISPGGTPYPSKEIRPESSSVSYLDIGSGILLYDNDYHIGLSLKHMNNPEITFLPSTREFGDNSRLPMRITFHGGYHFLLEKGNKMKESTFISPGFLVAKQGNFVQINGGAQMQLDKLITGAWYRHAGLNGDAFIGMLGWKYDIFKVCYSFDYTISDLGISSGGSHEIGIMVNLDRFYPQKNDYNNCFEIFK